MNQKEHLLVIPEKLDPASDVVGKAEEFLEQFQPLEQTRRLPLLLFFDAKSGAFYLICHLAARSLVEKTDLNAVLDPDESVDYKLNRELYTDTYAYQLMKSDAEQGRSFEDIVIEYDTSYRKGKPLKVFGGQHRVNAIKEAFEREIAVFHGVRVYFDLSRDQKVEIARVNNTSIAVPNDLLDRMQEDLLGPQLRKWCQTVGLLGPQQNFSDRRSSEGVPTVRIARTLLVNFYLGQRPGNRLDDLHRAVVCSSGPSLDKRYLEVRDEIDWLDEALATMGREFAKTHKLQRERVTNRTTDTHREFANKMLHLSVVSSWAYAVGLFQKHPQWLVAHYALADSVSPPNDPMNAKALSTARLKGVDSDTYRGMGTRSNTDELGRMLELFLLQATKAQKRGITKKLANAAIQSYETKKAQSKLEKALQGI